MDTLQIRCLDELESYARLSARNGFLKKNWYWLATAPLLLAIALAVRVLRSDTAASVLLGASGAWAFVVAGYCLVAVTRLLTVQCPCCGWRFGLGDRCGSCGFERHLPAHTRDNKREQPFS
jgi:predicted lysophospholipase L1 biosynthesis ABC-type transport system permease subunit